MIFPPPFLPASSELHPVKLLARAFNLLTRQQPWASQRLVPYAGQTLRICLGGFQLTLAIEPQGTLVAAEPTVVPNVVLELIAEKLSWTALLDPAVPPEFAQWVHITGSAALAQTISDLVQDLRPDPEDALAQWVGDIPARRLVRSAQSLFGAAQSLARGLTQNMAEYLAEESDTLAGRPALANLDQTRTHTVAHLEQLSQRQAALQARLQRLVAPPSARA
ncbi:MAG: hypothetical protein CK528_10595 [Alcaligenaceae bacterium]|nr:MAG: hypothetical protein CK528_10595 [Alcaligenaceae bacterium]